ncbi:ribose-phosphate diphosphokinase [Parasegetibacter sp. NRK P23]|uniref:ribose-phosphate diphosphokinase n=1 Tax=Parasegetibacter sp. NRK P23 TaxID=2942999 RepID=UPI0020446F2D|nr:ribose-phosphate diphosphokinase [Parasegetibacter sp. NRK P23]MCM5529777.1 ribose-phosphate diphosphokinase [Parasegetibacter sp. NRK P23]
MHTINLLYPQKSDVSFSTITFPDGQPHIKMDVQSLDRLDKKAPIRLLSRIANPADLMLVLFIKNTLDYHEFEHIELHIAYLMAARMDRVMTGGEPFSLKVVAAVLNQANFKKIRIFDPHSEVATALIDRSYIVTNHSFVKDALKSYFEKNGQESFCLVSPDAGALKKIHGLAQFLNVEHLVECMKERDVKTGILTNFTTTANNLDGLTCFIVDDICDGGGTFIGTAAMLKSKGASKVVLIVSHGIFSKGEKLEGIDEIFSTDSFRGLEGVHCFEVGDYL